MGLGTFKPGVFGVAPILLMGGGGLGTFNLAGVRFRLCTWV